MQDFLETDEYKVRMNKLKGFRILPLDRRIIKEGDLEFNQFPQILAYWRSKDGPFGDMPPPEMGQDVLRAARESLRRRVRRRQGRVSDVSGARASRLSDCDTCAASASSFAINLAGGVLFLALVLAGHFFFGGGASLAAAGFVALASMTLVTGAIACAEIRFLRVHLRPRVGFTAGAAPDWAQIKVKLFALCASAVFVVWAIIALGVLSIALGAPESTVFCYTLGFQVVEILLFPALAFGCAYILSCNAGLGNRQDGLWHFGALVLGRAGADRGQALSHVRSLALRSYFAPQMLGALVVFIYAALTGPIVSAPDGMEGMGAFSGAAVVRMLLAGYYFFSAMDVLFATIGYIAALRILDTDIRSMDSCAAGWVSCLICYQPVYALIMAPLLFNRLLANPRWYDWFAGHDVLMLAWGSLAALAMCAEALTTLTFGMRFSNLTWRGLMRTGLFRYTRHPQYVAKMIHRFMLYVPLFSLAGISGAGREHAAVLHPVLRVFPARAHGGKPSRPPS